jgi:ferrochelatase
MAYGSPDSADQTAEYFTHIRGGKTPSADAIARVQARYTAVGGRTPLLAISRDVARRLEAILGADATGRPYRVYLGMKHWHPFIADTVRTMAADGVERAIAIALAPHYSRISIGGYRTAVESAIATLPVPFPVRMVERWHAQPEFVEMMARLVVAGLERFPADARDGVTVVFTAHSLPERIREWDDPYERELEASGRAVAERLGIGHWQIAWQSAGHTGEPWIGPDILQCLSTLHTAGVRNVLQVPIGFVAEHLEVLWDIDIEARAHAELLGLRFARTDLPNARPALVEALAAVVRAEEMAATAA